jgi:hypothetical protein
MSENATNKQLQDKLTALWDEIYDRDVETVAEIVEIELELERRAQK